jgi:hypothetical protein
MLLRALTAAVLLVHLAKAVQNSRPPGEHEVVPPEISPEGLQFLFDKRLALFNTRRDHEWRVTFGAMALIGAVDAGLLTQKLHLSFSGIVLWWVALAVLFSAVTIYQFGVQTRNRVDRIAMDAIYLHLCDMARVPSSSMVRLRVDISQAVHGSAPVTIWNPTYLWAFGSQTVVLFMACLLSGALPDVINGAFTIAPTAGAPPSVR